MTPVIFIMHNMYVHFLHVTLYNNKNKLYLFINTSEYTTESSEAVFGKWYSDLDRLLLLQDCVKQGTVTSCTV